MRTAPRFAVIAKGLQQPALWFCASNLLAAALAAQCTSVSQVPNQTISSGTVCYSNNDTLTAAAVTINGSASVTFVAGHTVHLTPGFHATAGTAGTTFHAWVETAPSAISVSPSSGSGVSQQFTWTVSSPAGYGNIAHVFPLFNTSASGAYGCYIYYSRGANALFLANDAGTVWTGGFYPGTSSAAANSYCAIFGTGSSVSTSGNQLSLTVNVAFQPSTFSGTKNSYLNVYDNEDLYSGWQQVGTWTIPGTQQYYLTTAVSPSGGGAIGPPSGWYNSGAQVSVTAAPAAGYTFAGFSGNLAGTALPQVLAMNSNKSVTANFTATPPGQYSLTTSVNTAGTGTITPGSSSFSSGQQVQVTAAVNPGYQFESFTGVDSSNGTVGYVTMNSNRSVTANFAQSPSPLTITTATPLPGGNFGVAYSQTLAATGGTPPYAWSVADPPINGNLLPSGLSLSGSGVLSGTPTRAGQTYGFWVRVTDSLSATATKTFTLAIGPAVQPISGPSRLEVGLSFMPFDDYDFAHPASSKFPYSCPTGSSVRSCFQTVLAELRAQGVSGVRVFFQLCGPDSTPLVNCGQPWTQVYFAGLNTTWMNHVKDFFQDLKDASIQNITLTPAHLSGVPYPMAKSATRTPISPPPPDAPIHCADAPDTIYFYPTAPLGYKDVGGGQYHPIGGDLPGNGGYNCAPINPLFVGWQNQYNVIDAMLAAAAEKQLTVYELDFEQELNVMDFPALARFIVDNAQGDSGQPNVGDALRYYMGLRGFDAGRVTWSTPWSNSTLAGVNCTSVYGGYARTLPADQIASAIGGGLIGVPNSRVVGDGTGWLSCDSGQGIYPFDMFPMPTYGTQPDLLDVHLRPCVAGPSTHCVPNDAAAAVQSEARIDFDDIVNYIARFPSTATVMLGETHSNTDNGTGAVCEDGTLNAPAETVAGFNQSALAGTSVVFRSWMQLQHPSGDCFKYPGNQRVNFQGNGPYTPTQQ